MAEYDPPQPLWKRNVAGILDFLLIFFVAGFVVAKMFGSDPLPDSIPGGAQPAAGFSLTGWRAVGALVLIVAYFVWLGRTGGTVFQRLFGMKRAN